MAKDMVRLLRRANLQLGDIKAARAAWNEFREAEGKSPADLLTPPDGNTKFIKTAKHGVIVYGLSLAPHDVSGDYNVCRYSTPECRRGCVAFAGRGQAPYTTTGRILRTQFLAENPQAFVTLLCHEIGRAKAKYGKALRIRLNAFSDIPWEEIIPWLFVVHKDVRMYDYTKVPDRTPPKNYRLTFSASERTSDSEIVTEPSNVAVVFNVKRAEDLPKRHLGRRVIDGDKSDDRYMDRRGVIVGLRAKGLMRNYPTLGMVKEAS